MKASLKDLAGRAAGTTAEPAAPKPDRAEAGAGIPHLHQPDHARAYRTAQTREKTKAVGGHFQPEVSQTLRLIAAEQDKDIQEILAEALNMLFVRYGKATRAEVTSGRRKKTDANS